MHLSMRMINIRLKSSKARKGKEEVKFKHPGSTKDDDIECHLIEHNNDATIRDTDVNRLCCQESAMH